jgi:L-lactate dehydrogenase (cytochrome)
MSKVARRFPRYADLRQVLRFRSPIWSSKKRRLSQSLTIYDLRTKAKRRVPKAVFDYTDGSADGEMSLQRARIAFENVEFQPRVLRDVSNVDLRADVLGRRSNFPVGIAPTGFTRMMHTEGEIAGCTAAAEKGIPFVLSTMGTTSIEDVAAAAPGGRNWFQLYMWKDRDRSLALVERAQKAGFESLVLTVDVPVAGARLRDVRNGLTIPPSLTPSTILNAIPRPGWWWNFLTSEPLTFASLASWNGTVAELIDSIFDPTVTFDELKWIRKQWSGGLVVKGIQNVEDARLAVAAGADAILLSNHGGRQLDRAPVPLYLLHETVKEVGKYAEIHLDTGIMHGSDIITAIASGATFTWVGRAYLYGLMAGGREGVDRTLSILEEQMIRTMKLLGVRSLDELGPEHVKFLRQFRNPAALW